MANLFDRREALMAAGGLAAMATVPAAARSIAGTAENVKRMPLPAGTMFPHTDYYEVDSVKAGARYAIWVTVPKIYAKDPKRAFAAIYMPDGNQTAQLAAGLSDLNEWDLMNAFQPTIQIGIGYAGADIDRSLAVRARDLLPPNEYLLPGTEEGVRETAKAGLLDPDGAELYIRNLKNPAGDRFLAFLSEELHPFLAARYRIQPDTLGLHGYSYGGLFATYAALQKTTIFRNFGAGSPGIVPEKSVIFKLYADAVASGSLSARNLRMTVGTREITDAGIYQAMVGGGTVEFIRTVGANPLKGLTFTSRLIETETHATGGLPAMHDFLRTFYLRR